MKSAAYEELDRMDKAILNILQKDARMPLKEIAAQVFLSSPAVSSRMDRLRSAGYLDSYQASLNYRKLGYHIKAFISLEVEPIQKKEFYPFIQGETSVVECNCVTGDYSMLIEVLFKSTEELDIFVNRLQAFGKTKTQIVFSTAVEHRGILLD